MYSHSNLGLYLTEEELHFIGSQYGTNRFQTVNYNSILPSLPQVFSSIYHQRSQLQLTSYGYSFEEVWSQLYHPNTGYIYFNKFSKQVGRSLCPIFGGTSRFLRHMLSSMSRQKCRKSGIVRFLKVQTNTNMLCPDKSR